MNLDGSDKCFKGREKDFAILTKGQFISELSFITAEIMTSDKRSSR